jgi:hypothetical protein
MIRLVRRVLGMSERALDARPRTFWNVDENTTVGVGNHGFWRYFAFSRGWRGFIPEA